MLFLSKVMWVNNQIGATTSHPLKLKMFKVESLHHYSTMYMLFAPLRAQRTLSAFKYKVINLWSWSNQPIWCPATGTSHDANDIHTDSIQAATTMTLHQLFSFDLTMALHWQCLKKCLIFVKSDFAAFASLHKSYVSIALLIVTTAKQ